MPSMDFKHHYTVSCNMKPNQTYFYFVGCKGTLTQRSSVFKEKFEDAKGVKSEAVIRRTDNTKTDTKGQTKIYKILHRKLRIESHEPHQKGVNSNASKGRSAVFNETCSNVNTFQQKYIKIFYIHYVLDSSNVLPSEGLEPTQLNRIA